MIKFFLGKKKKKVKGVDVKMNEDVVKKLEAEKEALNAKIAEINAQRGDVDEKVDVPEPPSSPEPTSVVSPVSKPVVEDVKGDIPFVPVYQRDNIKNVLLSFPNQLLNEVKRRIEIALAQGTGVDFDISNFSLIMDERVTERFGREQNFRLFNDQLIIANWIPDNAYRGEGISIRFNLKEIE